MKEFVSENECRFRRLYQTSMDLKMDTKHGNVTPSWWVTVDPLFARYLRIPFLEERKVKWGWNIKL